MADVMVTARMTQAKKQEGNHVLKELGLSASQAINQLYDFLIANKETPFDDERSEAETKRASLMNALEFVESVPRVSRFSTMTDEQIKRERLVAKGLLSVDPEKDDA